MLAVTNRVAGNNSTDIIPGQNSPDRKAPDRNLLNNSKMFPLISNQYNKLFVLLFTNAD